MRLFIRKAQSTAEYAILISLVIAAVMAMQVYVKRGFQGGIKFATDKLKATNRADLGTPTLQYEPYYTMSEVTTTHEDLKSSEELSDAGKVERFVGLKGKGEKTTRTSKQVMRAASEDASE